MTDGASVDASAEGTRRAVEAVFADPELARGLELPDPDRVDRYGQAVQWLLEWLYGIMLRVRGVFDSVRSETPPWLTLLLLVLVVVLVAWLASRMSRAAGRAAAEEGGREEESAEQRERRFDDLLTEADGLAAGGAYNDGARALLLALLALIEQRHVLRAAAGFTNREIVARLRVSDGTRAELRRFAETIDGVAYGQAELDPAGYDRLKGLLGHAADEIRRLRPEGEAGAAAA